MENKLLSTIVAIVGIAIVVVIGGKNLVVNNTTNTPTVSYGSAGQVQSFLQEFQASMIVGGRVATSTTSATGTLTAGNIENATVIDYMLNLQDTTLTLPASSTISYMKNIGDTKTFYVRNATSTAAMDITFAAGTGMNYKKATSTKTLIGDTDAGNTARITLVRKANTDIDMFVDLFID